MESSVCQQYERSSLINFFYFSCRFQEGEAFLEEHGGVHENAKTRAQQKEIEESEEDSATKLKRTSTMAATAQVYSWSLVRKVADYFRFFHSNESNAEVNSLSRLFIFRKVVISLVIKSLEKLDQRRPPWKMRRTRTKMKTKKTRPKTARKKTTLKRTAQTNQLSNAMGQWLWLRR